MQFFDVIFWASPLKLESLLSTGESCSFVFSQNEERDAWLAAKP